MKIIIIGGGLSSALLTISLLREEKDAFLDITVVEKNPSEMLGQAYSTDKSFHLLNVPAQKMSAFPGQSEDFIHWLAEAGYGFGHGSYVPRKIYKIYIQDTLKKELNKKRETARYTFLQDCAVDIIPSSGLLLLGSGREIQFDKVILALGNFKPGSLNLGDNQYLQHPSYFASSWDPQLLRDPAAIREVFIIGTGLTMVDTVLSLQEQQYRGQITALSTHGFIPAAHRNNPPYEITDLNVRTVGTALDALKIVNKHIKEARRRHIDWQAVVDAIRPFTQEIWLHLPTAEKSRFMEHLRHIWGVARHRMPAECAGIIHKLLSERRLSIVAGRVRSIRPGSVSDFCIEYQDRSSKKNRRLACDIIINCMGPQSNYEKLDDLLIKNLLAKAMIRTDELRLGIDCTPEGAVIGKNGDRSPFLYTIGPPSKGVLWEITSVPEIRTAALQLAKLIVERKKELKNVYQES